MLKREIPKLFIKIRKYFPLPFSRIYHEFIIFFTNSLWIHHLIVRIYYKFSMFFANSLWIHLLSSRENITNPLSFLRITYKLTITLNPLSFSRINYYFSKFFANSLWIYSLFHEYFMRSRFILRIHYKSIIFIAYLVWI